MEHPSPEPQTTPLPQPGPGSSGGPAGRPGPLPPSGAAPATVSRSPRRIGMGALAAAVLAAGLVGGGVGAGAAHLVDGGPAAVAAPAADAGTDGGAREGTQGTGGQVPPTAATGVGQAAGRALPSVVTISVSSAQGSGSGSGSILDTEGHILTNTHVVTLGGKAADPAITVRTSDGAVYAATVVGTDPLSDLAVIKIDAQGLTPIELGSSKDLKVGDDAIAIGAPLGLPNTVTDGIISTLDRTIAVASSQAPAEGGPTGSSGAERFRFELPDAAPQAQQGEVYINVLQTDAAINPGNSGGALVDAQGRLVGVNVAIASAGGGSGEGGNIGVGFAIPVDYAHRVAEDLIAHGEATHGTLGVAVTPAPAQAQGADADVAPAFSDGALVREVVAGSAAEQAGLKAGDVIVAVDERAVDDTESLTAVVREQREGDTVTVRFRRDGQEQTAEATFPAGDGK